jgi:hypothetical protein
VWLLVKAAWNLEAARSIIAAAATQQHLEFVQHFVELS